MDLDKLWTDLIRQIKSYPNVNASQIDAFFSRIQIQAASMGFVMFTSDNSFIKDWIEKHYMKDIQQALHDLYNMDFFVQIEVDPNIVGQTPTMPADSRATSPEIATGEQGISPHRLEPEHTAGHNLGGAGQVQFQNTHQDTGHYATNSIVRPEKPWDQTAPLTPEERREAYERSLRESVLAETTHLQPSYGVRDTYSDNPMGNTSASNNLMGRVPGHSVPSSGNTVRENSMNATSMEHSPTGNNPIRSNTSLYNTYPVGATLDGTGSQSVSAQQNMSYQNQMSGQGLSQTDSPHPNSLVNQDLMSKESAHFVTNANNNLTFDTFVIGESNQMAYNMAVMVAEKPGHTELNLNPLFIYGRSGVGKTHLLCAIKNYINEQYPEFNVCYIDSMELVNKYSDAAIEKDIDKQSFKNFEMFFQQADVLLIDDIQGLQGKPGTLNALFRIFNTQIAKGKQFVFSADRAPKNIDLDERYVSRFNSGATVDIQPPDDETKRSIIKSFLQQYQDKEGLPFTVSDKILDYIVENSNSNIRELKSAMTNVIFAMTMEKDHELNEQHMQELLSNHFIGGGKKRITIEMIQSAVESFYGVAHKDLVGKKKERRIVHPRQVAIYLCRELAESTLKNIGKAFNRDHTTVMHSCDLITGQLQEDRNLREELEAIREKIRLEQY